MNPPPRPEDDPFLGYVVRRFAPEDARDPADSCPGDNLLTSLAGGSLLAGEREGLDAHLARCGRCREIAEVLSRRVASPARAGHRSLGFRARVAAGAAVAAIAAFVFGPDLLPANRGRGTPAPAGMQESLVASAADLARSRPDLFREFVPLSREERLARGPQLRAGDLALLYPSGRILETRPAFRWEAAAGREDEIVLRTARGEVIWRGTGRAPLLEYPAEAPDLRPGVRYVWEVSRAGRRIFATASAEERAAFEASVKAIETGSPPPLCDLLVAQLAVRGEFFSEAERAARAFVAAEPADAVGRETLAHVLRRMGSSEAERWVAAEPR
jgi:hypothetical protein